MENNTNKKSVIFIIFCVLILIILFIYNNNNTQKEETYVEKNNIKLLNDYNKFFTVNSCIFKYISYIQNKDVESILKVLNKEYIENNKINLNNIYDYVENLEGKYSFVSKKIYYKRLNSRYIKYYVQGELIKDVIDTYGEKSERYYVLTLDIENQLFDIIPFDKLGFEEVANG